jgi:HrpA-like RNA helicase
MTIYALQVIGIDDICGFGFMDPPDPNRVNYALKSLKELGALDRELLVTELGYNMAEFPLSPNLAKVSVARTWTGI